MSETSLRRRAGGVSHAVDRAAGRASHSDARCARKGWYRERPPGKRPARGAKLHSDTLQFLAKTLRRQEGAVRSRLPLPLPTRSVRRASGFVQTAHWMLKGVSFPLEGVRRA